MKTFVAMHAHRGTLSASFGVALVAALATGCTTDASQQPATTSQSTTVQAAAATTQATGIVSWEVYGGAKDMQMLGVGADGAVISALQFQMVDDQTVSMRTIGDHPEELRFTKSGKVLIDTLTSDAQTMGTLHAMSNDVQAVKEQYSFWGCVGSTLVAAGACGAAGYELGLNPFADMECAGGVTLEVVECSS